MQISQSTLKLAFLFIASYFVLYFGYPFVNSFAGLPLHPWQFKGSFAVLDYMYFLMPVVGFFVLYLLIDWLDDYYKTGFAHSPFFPVLFVALSLAAFYTSLHWYFSNLAALGSPSAMNFDYAFQLFDSAFLLFVLSGILGWVSHLVMHRVAAGAAGSAAGGAERAKKQPQQTSGS